MKGYAKILKDERKRYEAIEKEIEKTRFSYVEVGYIGDKGGNDIKKDHDGKQKGSLTVSEVATVMEYGSAKMNIPARPTLTTTFDEQKESIFNNLKEEYSKVLEGKTTTEKALTKLGIWLQAKVIQKINALVSPPLAPATIKAKGSSKPLIDTGQMRQSIKPKVVIVNTKQTMAE